MLKIALEDKTFKECTDWKRKIHQRQNQGKLFFDLRPTKKQKFLSTKSKLKVLWGSPMPVIVKVICAKSNVAKNKTKNKTRSVFHTTIFLRQESVSDSIAQSIHLKVILMGRITALPSSKKKTSDPD